VPSSGNDVPTAIKKIAITLESTDYNTIRSYIGGFYRAGYDEIQINFINSKTIQILHKIIDSLEGFDIFDIKKDSCIIKSILQINEINVRSHFLKMIYTITVLQETIMDSIKNKKYNTKNEIFELRNKTLKQRDFICRSLIQLKLLDTSHFPYYQLSFNLWTIARNYSNIYDALLRKQITQKNKYFLEKTNKFFQDFFNRIKEHSHSNMHNHYKSLIKEGIKLMSEKNEASIILSYCINILMITQSSNSQILIINL